MAKLSIYLNFICTSVCYITYIYVREMKKKIHKSVPYDSYE